MKKKFVDNNRFIRYDICTSSKIIFSSLLVYFQIVEEWRFIALILDRLFLIIFVSVSLIGTLGSLLKAPSLYNSTPPVDPLCYLYYPPLHNSSWMNKCANDYLYSLVGRQSQTMSTMIDNHHPTV